MKSRVPLTAALILTLLAFSAAVGCSRGPSDAEVAAAVQGKIGGDANVSSKQIGVTAQNGVVTLSGTVDSEMERAAAGNAAAQAEGVKTVVNNLQVQEDGVVSYDDPAASQPPASNASAPRRTTTAQRSAPSRTVTPARAAPATDYNQPAAAPAPAPVRRVTIPEGTTLAVRLADALDSEKNRAGDVFRATLDVPLSVDGEVVMPANVDVEGVIVDAKDAGRFKGRSELVLELTKIIVNGRTYPVKTNHYLRQGASEGKHTAAKAGGGAALGAIIGGIAGGGKGAAIGAAAGAGAGTGAQAVTGGKPIRLPAETVLNFQLQDSISVIPSSTRSPERRRLE